MSATINTKKNVTLDIFNQLLRELHPELETELLEDRLVIAHGENKFDDLIAAELVEVRDNKSYVGGSKYPKIKWKGVDQNFDDFVIEDHLLVPNSKRYKLPGYGSRKRTITVYEEAPTHAAKRQKVEKKKVEDEDIAKPGAEQVEPLQRADQKDEVENAKNVGGAYREHTERAQDNGSEAIIKKIIDCKERVICVNAVAGAGKTTMANKLAETHAVMFMSFTREVVSQFRGSSPSLSSTCDKFIISSFSIPAPRIEKWFRLRKEVTREDCFTRFNMEPLSNNFSLMVPSNIEFVVIDEFTMCGYNYLMLMIELVLKNHKCKVLLLGDIMQNGAIGAGKNNNVKSLMLSDVIFTMDKHMRALGDEDLIALMRAMESKNYDLAFEILRSISVDHIDLEDFIDDCTWDIKDSRIIVRKNSMLYNISLMLASALGRLGVGVFFDHTHANTDDDFEYNPLVLGWWYRLINTKERFVGRLVSISYNELELRNDDGCILKVNRCRFPSPRNSISGEWRTFPIMNCVVENAYIVQGLTIEDTVYIFAGGMNMQQLYVAISRCRRLDQLKVI